VRLRHPLLKTELHSHTSDDPTDAIPYSAEDLIDAAAGCGYDALAITLHDKQIDLDPLRAHAERRRVVLIPGVERTLDGCHVLLLNFSHRAASVGSFGELADLKAEEHGLVVAPHPFFPLGHSVGRLFDRYADVFDAVEINAMFTRALNYNKQATRWARDHRKPLVGNGDVHRLAQLGSTYSMVDAERNPDSICEAIRAGRVEVRSRPLSWLKAGAICGDIIATSFTRPRLKRGQRLP
jgi:predicted metal-dependent phosphoesterase TrpH